MAFSHTIGGTTFTQANFEGNAYSDEATGFPKAMEKMAEHVANAYRGISTTSNAVGTGSKTWTVTNSNSQIPAFAVGMPVRVARTSAPTTTYMQGEITAFTASTGSTTVNVSSSLGSGTHTDWTIVIGGHQTTAAASPLGIAAGGTGGGTAAAARTALGIADSASAYAGVLESNAGFVDQCLLGPAVDGRSWNGLWNKAGVFSSLMLATISDEGSSTRVRIWDLTEETAGVISTTQLASVDLSAAATPTAIAACMSYCIVGSEDGISIIDPWGPSGTWAERTTGWPKTLTSSSVPELGTGDPVNAVGAGLARQPAFDPRTGGPMPTFAVSYAGGSKAFSILKDNATVFDRAGSGKNAVISDGRMFVNLSSVLYVNTGIDTIVADDSGMQLSEVGQAGSANNLGFASDVADGCSVVGNDLAYASSTGLTRSILPEQNRGAGYAIFPINALITRTYNTGFLASVCKGAFLANSKTADRSAFSNTLTETGTVTEGPASGSGGTASELQAYSGFSSSNHLDRVYDADFDFATGMSWMVWVKILNNSAEEIIFHRIDAGGNTPYYGGSIHASTGKAQFHYYSDASGTGNNVATYGAVDDGVWHFVVGVFDQPNGIVRIYLDGQPNSGSTATYGATGSLAHPSDAILGIGENPKTGTTNPMTSGSIALLRLSATIPSEQQIRQIYDAEKGLFVESAKALLGSPSTDAVLDVDVDRLTGKVLVTQTDKINIFDGLVNVSQPAVNDGAPEKGKLWGDLRAEQTSSNAYVTAPATDQRQVNEMVRGLASDLPAVVDLSKAKAWLRFDLDGSPNIDASFNISHFIYNGTGDCQIHFGVPFKSTNYASTLCHETYEGDGKTLNINGKHARAYLYNASGAVADCDGVQMVFFGELENE